MSHKSEKLEQYIGKLVKIDFKLPVGAYKGKIKAYTGILQHNEIGFRPYRLVTKDFDYVFVKTDVRKIEEVKNESYY